MEIQGEYLIDLAHQVVPHVILVVRFRQMSLLPFLLASVVEAHTPSLLVFRRTLLVAVLIFLLTAGHSLRVLIIGETQTERNLLIRPIIQHLGLLTGLHHLILAMLCFLCVPSQLMTMETNLGMAL
jgi:hypothetical protein